MTSINPRTAAISVAGFVFIAVSLYTFGCQDADKKLKADLKVATSSASSSSKAVVKADASASSSVSASVSSEVAHIKYVTRYITKEVPIYVTPETDASHPVPWGAVRLLDSAASGVTPTPPGPADPANDTNSPFALSAVVGTTTYNYGQCLEWKAQVDGWQGWYKQLQKDHNNP